MTSLILLFFLSFVTLFGFTTTTFFSACLQSNILLCHGGSSPRWWTEGEGGRGVNSLFASLNVESRTCQVGYPPSNYTMHFYFNPFGPVHFGPVAAGIQRDPQGDNTKKSVSLLPQQTISGPKNVVESSSSLNWFRKMEATYSELMAWYLVYFCVDVLLQCIQSSSVDTKLNSTGHSFPPLPSVTERNGDT